MIRFSKQEKSIWFYRENIAYDTVMSLENDLPVSLSGFFNEAVDYVESMFMDYIKAKIENYRLAS